MSISQNARFSGEAAPDAEFDEPPGRSIVRLLKDALAKRGWEVSEIDNWRDGGWCITSGSADSKLELVVVKMTIGSEWFLQIAPSYVPWVIGWLLKKHASASPEEIQALANDAFSVLSQGGRFTGFMWCWDGYPNDENSTPKPEPAQYGSS